MKKITILACSLFLLISVHISPQSNAALPLTDGSGKELPSLAPMLKEVNPAVVNIATFSQQQQANNPLLNDPFFRFFFDIPQNDPRFRQRPQRRQQSAGSGVIVDAKDGIVITNYHVIRGADEVQVSLVDGRTFQANVRGVDPELDVAVLEIEADELAEVEMNTSNQLEVGDFVVAIGNPFGLGQTVTTGVVSALGRTGLGIEGYENFIQTDASINPGNSGGALVNLRGELIGINTAIIAPAGGNVGIGFAIPTNMVEASMQQILKHGEVRRGVIGVAIQEITPDLRQAFNLKANQQGVLVTDVNEDSPADKAGLRPGDIILSVNDSRTVSSGQLRSQLSIVSIGETVELEILRDGKQRTVDVKVREPDVSQSQALHRLLQGAQFAKASNVNGVVVTGLDSNSPAARSGLRPGDVITSVNRQRVTDMDSFARALAMNNQQILLYVNRGGSSFYLIIR